MKLYTAAIVALAGALPTCILAVPQLTAREKLNGRTVGLVKTKGHNLVTNGGFESGKLAPWKTTANSSGPRDGPVDPKVVDHCESGEPLFDVVSPGLPAMAGIPRSKHKARFCGVAGEYFDYEHSALSFSFLQNISGASASKTYVLTVEFRAFNTVDIQLKYANSTMTSVGGYYYPFSDVSNATTIVQGVFDGLAGTNTLALTFLALGGLPRVEAQAYVDNVSIHEVHES